MTTLPAPPQRSDYRLQADWLNALRSYIDKVVNLVGLSTVTFSRSMDNNHDILKLQALITLKELRGAVVTTEKARRQMIMTLINNRVLNIREAAEAAGYQPNSVAAWLKNPEKALRDAEKR